MQKNPVAACKLYSRSMQIIQPQHAKNCCAKLSGKQFASHSSSYLFFDFCFFAAHARSEIAIYSSCAIRHRDSIVISDGAFTLVLILNYSRCARSSSPESGERYAGGISSMVFAPFCPSSAIRFAARAHAIRTLVVNSGLESSFRLYSIM